ncbi:hypothetical protein MMC32_007750 [Xylographa parallela]|nr:hypothetical protein [Xylographa parallela]
MSSTFKGSFGRKSNAAPDVAPPSYATRPPKNHKKALSIIDSEEDDEVMPPSHVDRGRSKQVYNIDSDDEETPHQSERPRTRARSHGGKGKVDHNRSDAHWKQRSHHDSGRRGTSQALVRREPSLSDEEPGPSRGHRGANKSKVNNEETITIGRFRVLSWKELVPADRTLTADIFEISLGQLMNYVDDGKIRMDNKNTQLDYELMYPLFPPYIVNRVKNEIESFKRATQNMGEHGRNRKTIIETRFLVPVYFPPYPEQCYEPTYEDEYGQLQLGVDYPRRPGGRLSHGRGHSSRILPWPHDPFNLNCLCSECGL